MPPVLHVAFRELATRRSKNMFTSYLRLCIYQRHHILQLIAETISTTGLVKG